MNDLKTERKRPLGVTVIAILNIIGGILLLVGGISFIMISSLVSQVSVSDTSSALDGNLSPNLNDADIMFTNNALSMFLGGFMGILGAILIALGIASFIVAWGLLKGKGWAWIITIIIAIISIVIGVIFIAISIAAGDIVNIGGNIVGLIIDGVIIWYLYRPNVKLYFGRIKAPTT